MLTLSFLSMESQNKNILLENFMHGQLAALLKDSSSYEEERFVYFYTFAQWEKSLNYVEVLLLEEDASFYNSIEEQ